MLERAVSRRSYSDEVRGDADPIHFVRRATWKPLLGRLNKEMAMRTHCFPSENNVRFWLMLAAVAALTATSTSALAATRMVLAEEFTADW